MTKGKLLISGGFFTAAALGVFLLSDCCSDWTRTEFATLEAAKAAQAFERGWLPPMLPAGTTHIVEINNVDTNRGRGSFRFPPESIPPYLAAIRADPGATVTESPAGIQIRLTTQTNKWTIELDQKNGVGQYTVGL